ncbi:EH domain-binding protein 1 [Liparis tanakae]|uniref:EH domain-binding protein 1 n=1 Tax=Liparis tanakae TaxID=230148 RepID=A0A4Z2HEJ8_9TELE|nr:EH domain-binding protein 1 [Liparis tanakae]
MTSVWKRLQRVGKKASKFQFVASYQELVLECSKKWQPDKLRVVWTRRNRRMCSKLHSWQPGIKNPYRGMVVWPVPENIDISVTLFKEVNADEFEDKEWTFVIEGENKGHRKVLASADINLKRFASPTPTQIDLTLKLKPLSVKVVDATLKLSLSCVFVREGKATILIPQDDHNVFLLGSPHDFGRSIRSEPSEHLHCLPTQTLLGLSAHPASVRSPSTRPDPLSASLFAQNLPVMLRNRYPRGWRTRMLHAACCTLYTNRSRFLFHINGAPWRIKLLTLLQALAVLTCSDLTSSNQSPARLLHLPFPLTSPPLLSRSRGTWSTSGGDIPPVPLLSSPDLDAFCDPAAPALTASLPFSSPPRSSSLSTSLLFSSPHPLLAVSPSAPPASISSCHSGSTFPEETTQSPLGRDKGSPQDNRAAAGIRASNRPIRAALDSKEATNAAPATISPVHSRSELIIAPPPPWPFSSCESSTPQQTSTNVVAAFITPKQPNAEGGDDMKTPTNEMGVISVFKAEKPPLAEPEPEPDFDDIIFESLESQRQQSGGLFLEEDFKRDTIKRNPPG